MQASSLAKEAQTSGFAVRMPQWISRLCMPHWSIALTLLSNLDLAWPEGDAAAAELTELTTALRRVLDIFSDFFRAAGGATTDDTAFGDEAADAVLSYVLNSTCTSAASSGSSDGPSAATIAPLRPSCESPLSNVQSTAPAGVQVVHSSPVLPASTFDDPPPVSRMCKATTMFLSLEDIPVNDSSAFENAECERIMSDVVDVGPQAGFSLDHFQDWDRCFIVPSVFAVDTVSLSGSDAYTEPPPEPGPPLPATSSLQRLRPSPLSVPSPRYTPPASQLLLPSQSPSLAEHLPKPSVESFGLEQDEVTAISLAPTPIPSLLALCRGPSRRTTPIPAVEPCMHVDSSADDSTFGDSSDSQPASPSGTEGLGGLGSGGSTDSGAAGGSSGFTGAPVPSPFAGTALLVASNGGDSCSAASPTSEAPPTSPSPPPPCRSPEPMSARIPADDVGIPFSTLFAPTQLSAIADGAGSDAFAGAAGDGNSCCNIFGSGGTARMMTQPPCPPEPSCRAVGSGLWGDGGFGVIAAHSSWHTPAYERDCVTLSDDALGGDGASTVSDDGTVCASGSCPTASECCCVELVCSDVQGASFGDAPRRFSAAEANRHRRTVSVPAVPFSVSSRQLPMTPDERTWHPSAAPGGERVSQGSPDPASAAGRDADAEVLDTMPCSLMPRPAAAWDGDLWGRDGPSGMASRRARSICLDNLKL